MSENSGSLTAIGGEYAAGIGSNDEDVCGNIEIKGGTITAQGGSGGAGIGTGKNSCCGDIKIKNSTITAQGGSGGAGIGDGYADGDGTTDCGNIIISGGTVTASDIRGHLVKGDITISDPKPLKKAEINAQDVTFAIDTEGNLVVDGTIHPTRNGNKFTFNAVYCDVTATVENGEVTGVTYLKSLRGCW